MFDKLKDMVPDMPDMPEMNLPDIPGTDLIPGMEKDEKAKDLIPSTACWRARLTPWFSLGPAGHRQATGC